MPKFLVKVEAEYEIEASDEEHAEELFFGDIVNDTQSDPASFISEHLSVQPIRLCERTGCKARNYKNSAWCFKHGKELAEQQGL